VIISVEKLINILSDIIQIAAGGQHSSALSNVGQIYLFGFGHNIPTVILANVKFKQIATNRSNSMFLTNHGEIYISGGIINTHTPRLVHNLNGVIQILPQTIDYCVLMNTGEVYTFEDNIRPPKLVPYMKNIIQIAGGSSDISSILGLNDKGQVYGWGYNKEGQLGLGDFNNRIIAKLNPYLKNIINIAAGEKSSLALNSSGQVYAFGSSLYGQLGLGDRNTINIPTLIPNIINITYMAIGYHTMLLRNDGQIYACGNNENGQLGLGTTNKHGDTSTFIPQLIPNFNLFS